MTFYTKVDAQTLPRERNTPETERFLRGLAGRYESGGYLGIVHVQHVPHPETGKPAWDERGIQEIFYRLPHEWERLLEDLPRLINKHPKRCFYVCTQLLKGKSRKKTFSKALKVVWAEWDAGTDLPDDIPPPSMIVESSPGNCHVYWFLKDEYEPEEVEQLCKRVAYGWKGFDRGGWDLSQVLRIPGSRNNKYKDSPSVKLVKAEPSIEYTLEEFSEMVPQLPEKLSKTGGALTSRDYEERRGEPIDLEDRELLEKARNARDEVGERFRALYDGGDFLEHASHSEARLELLKHLAFWTAWDAERMSRLYEGSALYQMPGYARKWVRLGERECQVAIAATPRAYRQQARPSKDEGGKDLASIVATLRAQAESMAWEGRGGPNEKHVYGALLDTAAVYGTVVKRGILVSADARNLALAAGVGLGTVSRSLKRLSEERNLIRLSKKSTRMRAHVYLLKHPEKRTSVSGTQNHCVDYVPPTELLCRQLRNRGPSTESEFDKNGRKRSVGTRHLLSRLGKYAALILEYVSSHAGEDGLTLREIARGLGRKPQNVENSKAFARLLDSDLLVADGERFNVPEDLKWRLEVELEESGCNEARRLASENFDRERKSFRTRHARKADEGPSEEDMRKERLRRIQDALDVLQTRGTGPQMILQSYLTGGTKTFEYVVNAVTHYFGSIEPEIWREPVEEAVALIGGGEA